MSNTPQSPIFPAFTHLHLHSEYSFLDGANRIPALIARLKSLGMRSVALSDHGCMFGALDFYLAALKAGIKPIVGIETYIHNGENLGDKEPYYHLCLFAKDREGYENLMYLSSQAYLHGFYRHPRINKNLLRDHAKGVICSSACLAGEISYHLNTSAPKQTRGAAKGYDYAKKVALEYKEIFGEDFYIEIMRHGLGAQRHIDTPTIALAKETGIKLIATNDAHYGEKKDAFVQEVLKCVATAKNLGESGLSQKIDEFYVKSSEEMARLFADLPEALLNTQEIADKCNLVLDLKSIEVKNEKGEILIKNTPPTPPSFRFTKDYAKAEGLDFEDDDAYFSHKCEEGLKTRLKAVSPELHETYRARLEYEMGVIKKMKFSGYMLIVWDFVREAKKRKIPVGPGRGSAAGSLVAFCLSITNIDPIKHDLLFERFLNPERISMPDIDTDFCQERRGEVIEYVTQKYGANNVSQVVTFASHSARSAIRDVARVLKVDLKKTDSFAKLIPKEPGIKLAAALEKEPRIAEAMENDAELREIWRVSLMLEGGKRGCGTHAAAIVIDTQKELWHKVPLCRIKPKTEKNKKDESKQTDKKDKIATQYSMNFLENVDLVKFDFLGLKTLTVIEKALELVSDEIDLDNLDLEDKKVYELIQSGETNGIFQIESDGMKNLNQRLRTNSFSELAATVALYRPGPMDSGMLDDFIERKHGRAAVEYAFGALEPILKGTYGIVVYQEQVMQIVQEIGGFSLGEADLIRRAMGKKDMAKMKANKEKFLSGAAARGFEVKKCDALWELIVKFAEYGFNKSHSVAYAAVSFQTAFLKTYYKCEFMAALLSSEAHRVNKINRYIQECRHMGIPVLPPHINRSMEDFSVEVVDGKKSIIFGLAGIKGVGEKPIQTILNARKNGAFSDLSDFLGRVDSSTNINKKVIESLAKSGALRGLGFSTRAILEGVDTMTEIVRENAKAAVLMGASGSLFADIEVKNTTTLNIENLAEYAQNELLELEYEMLGVFISANPLQAYAPKIAKIKGVVQSYELEDLADGAEIFVVGLVKKTEIRTSKNGKNFASVLVVDGGGNVEITAFSRHIPELEKLPNNEPFALKCRADVAEIELQGAEEGDIEGEEEHEKADREEREKEKIVRVSLRLEDIFSLEKAATVKTKVRFRSDIEGVDSSDFEDSRRESSAAQSLAPQSFILDIPRDLSYEELKEIQALALENMGKEQLIFRVEEDSRGYILHSSYYINARFKDRIRGILEKNNAPQQVALA